MLSAPEVDHWIYRIRWNGFVLHQEVSFLAVVTPTEALLWTDSRYFLQAEKELPSCWQLKKLGTPGCPKVTISNKQEWLASSLPEGSQVGVDGSLISTGFGCQLESTLHPFGINLVCLDSNLIDQLWSDRPRISPCLFAYRPSPHSHHPLIHRVRRTLHTRQDHARARSHGVT